MSASIASALYPGHVMHARRRPVEHRLDYRIFSVLLDLTELDQLSHRLWLFSVDRFNLFSFSSKSRGDGSGRDLRKQVESWMQDAGVEPDGGPIRILTMPRVLGWSFNPLSVYFCHRVTGEVAAILWEVDNTFGERHGYMIPVDSLVNDEIRQSCDKAFYVSPFMDMSLRYAFRVKQTPETIRIGIDTFDGDDVILTARHSARRVELTDGALLRAFLSLPHLMLRVIVGIHWQAMKLWLKGLRLRNRPEPPEHPVSIIPRNSDHSPEPAHP